ncbi:MAG: N-acetyltransferase [Actinobacteria bacterium]|nr:N-acetyltransferase [Actinomycetota bacterium]
MRPLLDSDRDAFIAVANDPLIWEEHPEPDRATAEKVDRFFADAIGSGGAVVVTDADGKIIGSSRFEEPDEAVDLILIDHTFLARPDRARALVEQDHAFTAFGTIELQVGVHNARTRHAVEDFLGAAYVETVLTPLGDHALYELSRSAWAERA